MPDLDELRRTFTRIADLDDFDPAQRIWWIYVRNAAIEVARVPICRAFRAPPIW